MTELIELAARCEAASGPDRDLDEQLDRATFPHEWVGEFFDPSRHDLPNYTGSLDAAITLVPKELGYVVGEGRVFPDEPLGGALITPSKAKPFDPDNPPVSIGQGPSAALALCAAALRAHAAVTKDSES